MGRCAARHGFISPDGGDKCEAKSKHPSYVLNCGAGDNAGKLIHARYGEPNTA